MLSSNNQQGQQEQEVGGFNQEKQKNNNKQKNSFSNRYTKATTTGLKNLGNTSYLNAVLQLLGSIRPFASFFTNPQNQKFFSDNISSLPFSFIIYRLFLHLYPYPEKEQREIYKPDSLHKHLGEINVVYKSLKERNPNDLIIFILDTLHKELNHSQNQQKKEPQNIYDKNNVLECFKYNFLIEYNSVISNHLNWCEIKRTECSVCKKRIYNIQTYNSLELDILQCFRNKNNTPLNIYDCLQYYIRIKNYSLFCNLCKKCTSMMSYTKILSSTNILIFSLNRGNFDQNLMNISFQVDNNLNLDKFIEYKNSLRNYILTGIVSFSLNDKKYVSFCRSPVDFKWYLYNDDIIQPIEIKNILLNHNNNNQYIPCILIYTSSFNNK